MSKHEMQPLDRVRLERQARLIRYVAQFGTREQIIGLGVLPETADALILVRELFTGAWWHSKERS